MYRNQCSEQKLQSQSDNALIKWKTINGWMNRKMQKKERKLKQGSTEDILRQYLQKPQEIYFLGRWEAFYGKPD